MQKPAVQDMRLGLIIGIYADENLTRYSEGLVGVLQERYSVVAGRVSDLAPIVASVSKSTEFMDVVKGLAELSGFGFDRTMIISNERRYAEAAHTIGIASLWARSDDINSRTLTWRFKGRDKPLKEMPLLEAIQKVTKEWHVPVRPLPQRVENGIIKHPSRGHEKLHWG